MKAPALFQIAEGIVGTLGKNSLNYPQAQTYFLKGLKDVVNFNANHVDNDHVVTATTADLDDTEEAIGSDGALYLYGVLAKTIDTAAVSVIVWDQATGAGNVVPGTTATSQRGHIYLPLGSSTTPSVGSVLWFPFQYFAAGCQIIAVAAADDTSDPGASTSQAWAFHRNQS